MKCKALHAVMEAVGIEPTSDGSGDDSEGESDLPGVGADESASEPSHEVAETDDDPRSQRRPSGEAESAPPEVPGDESAG